MKELEEVSAMIYESNWSFELSKNSCETKKNYLEPLKFSLHLQRRTRHRKLWKRRQLRNSMQEGILSTGKLKMRIRLAKKIENLFLTMFNGNMKHK